MKAVIPQITDLLGELQSLECLHSFALAGGTNLAIRYNHRVSEDIDLFTDKMIGADGLCVIKEILSKRYRENLKFCELINQESGDQYCFLRALIRKGEVSIKVEFIQNVLTIQPTDIINNLRLLSVQDIGILKLFSAASRKANKDIYDLDLITDEIPLNELWRLMETRLQRNRLPERKSLFDLDGESELPDNISLLLDFDNIDYTNLPKRPSHSNDRLLLLPSSKSWVISRSNWKRKVKDFMRSRGTELPKIKPVN